MVNGVKVKGLIEDVILSLLIVIFTLYPLPFNPFTIHNFYSWRLEPDTWNLTPDTYVTFTAIITLSSR